MEDLEDREGAAESGADRLAAPEPERLETDPAREPESGFPEDLPPSAAESVTESKEDSAEGTEEEPGGADAMSDAESGGEGMPALPLLQVVEAILFAAPEPLTLPRLARAAGKGVRREEVRAAIDELNVLYLEGGRAFEIAEISGGFRMLSRPEYVEHVRRVLPKTEAAKDGEALPRLTPSVLETLAIIAYKQPVTKADIERIRGVNCDSALGTLARRGSVMSERNAEVLGSPRSYRTTDAFLVEFGLGSLAELPLRGELSGPPAAASDPSPCFPESGPIGESA